MKKLLIPALLTAVFSANAEYSPNEKTVKVILTQGPTSGLSNLFRQIENYALSKNIVMVPVYKPGGSGVVGVNYAVSNEEDTLLLALTSDIVASNNVDKIVPVSVINDITLDLVSSKRSNLTTLDDIINAERKNPGSLNWGSMNTTSINIIHRIAKEAKLDFNKINIVNYSNGAQLETGVISGDLDLIFLPTHFAKKIESRTTNIELPDKLRKTATSTALFLHKKSSGDAATYWGQFIKDFLDNEATRKAFKENNMIASVAGEENIKETLRSYTNEHYNKTK